MITSGALVITTTIIAFFVKDLDAVIDLAGAFGGGTTAFVLPPLAYMHCMDKNDSKTTFQKMKSWRGALVVFGSLLTLFLTVVTAYNFAAANDDIGEVTCGLGARNGSSNGTQPNVTQWWRGEM